MSAKKCQVDICIGAGGVGKTTVASVLGLYYASLGEKTLVITVDPAKRLLDALGIASSSLVTKVDLSFLTLKNLNGELYALMPDLKQEWMDFLKNSIKKSQVRHEISSNHFYQYLVDGLPGAFEIICSHLLFRLIELGEYDRIILDTPPSSHGLAFFDVPEKILGVLEQGIFRALMNKRNSILLKLTKKLAFFSGGLMEKTIERLIGTHFLSEVIDFALSIDSLYEPLLKRAMAMKELLKNKKTRYFLVLRPTTASIADGIYLNSALKSRGINIHQVILNQVKKEEDLKTLALERKAMVKEKLLKAVHLIDMYKNEIELEKHLIEKLKHEFLHTDMRKLYLSEALDRKGLLSLLLADYEIKE
jgi:anion-transporting  ArsA/GET3 family ATPase